MANQVSLMSYLQEALQAIPTNPPARVGSNTTNTEYSPGDINNVGVWQNFTLDVIREAYQDVLDQTQIRPEPLQASPLVAITAEGPLKTIVSRYVNERVRRGLRASFNHLENNNSMDNMTVLSVGDGEYAKIIDRFTPDIAYHSLAAPTNNNPNRAPGDVKPSWKWSSGLATHALETQRTEYLKPLCQVNWYMKQHRSRYGFILTDRELVVIRRLDNDGNLELTPPIPFTRGGSADHPELTVNLALWYLGMLAAQDQGPNFWYM